jgi:hypothetical protein
MPKLIIKNKYGIIPNEILNSKELSLSAKGLYGYLQSKPDGWRFSISRMASQLKEGKDAIRRAILELEKFGLLKRIPKKDKGGRWVGYDYELREELAENPPISPEKLAENPTTENPTTANPTTGFPYTISNIDNSKKEYSKKENIYNIATQSVAGKEINELIKLFKEINPTYERLFVNKSQRQALERLVKKFGKEKVAEMIKFLPKIFGKPYAPRITTPLQLEHKLADLISYLKQEQNKKPKVAVIKTQ